MDGNIVTLIKTPRSLFAKMGVPVKLTTVGGPSFTAYDFGRYCKQWGIKHRLESAHYPQSNGQDEAAVKSSKRLLWANTERGARLTPTG